MADCFLQFRCKYHMIARNKHEKILGHFVLTECTTDIYVSSLMVIGPSVLMIMHSQAFFAYIMSPMTFDLMTQKYNQFIGSTRYIYDPSLARIHQPVLEIT